ncbi:potassium transporter TrkA [bacterium F11]|nr:potassium transporter TrkA [bacterium F11]
MKFFSSELSFFLKQPSGRRNLKLVLRFFIILVILIAVYTILFHILMAREGQSYSWFTGVYWTLTVMSTLGFGDVIFHTDLGRLFSSVVLLSGMIWLLVMMPFVFMEFFYQPWMKAQLASRTPRKISADIRDHVILTQGNAITFSLIELLDEYKYQYVLLESDPIRAAELQDSGINVVVGDMHDPKTYKRIQIDTADMLVATSEDKINTNTVFTVHELNEKMPIISTAKNRLSVEIMKLAGASHVLELGNMMGNSLARRTLSGGARAHVIGRFNKLLIAEALCMRTPLVGKKIVETNLRASVGIQIIGVWEKNVFKFPEPNTRITNNTVLVIVGSIEQIRGYNELFVIYNFNEDPVVIIGGGRVGRAAVKNFDQRKVAYRVVEKLPGRIQERENYILGDAANLEVLKKAGIDDAPAVIITPHDDDMNIYLSIFIRRLKPDIQIISRATKEKNVSSLYRAGSDFVMSDSSMGSHAIFNLLKRSDFLMLTEGLSLVQMPLPKKLVMKSIVECAIREKTGCQLVALNHNGVMGVNPDPFRPLPENSEIVLIGSEENQNKFLQTFGDL